MRRQTLLAVAVAVFLGLIAVYLANTYLAAGDARNRAGALTRVAVAAVPLDYGTELSPDKIRFADYPASSIPPGAFTDISKLLPGGQKRVALVAMGMNEPILANKITGPGQGASIAALLPAGMRAASVRINDVSGVSGFVQPNDSVDVLITRPTADRNNQITDMLLQNVRVIAIDQDSKGADGKPTVAKTATLQVDPLAAQKLALAQEVGSLSLVLRKPGEEGSNPFVETVSMNDLRSNAYGTPYRPTPVQAAPARRVARPAPRPQPKARPIASAPAKPRPNVEVIRGTEASNYEVGGL
jgi:pilus assembly protein CpaB